MKLFGNGFQPIRTDNKAGNGVQNGRLFTTITLFAVICMAVYMIGHGGTMKSQPLEIQGFAFDTTYKISLYQGGDKDLLQDCVSLCSDYENTISRTVETSEVAQINALSAKYEELLTDEQLQKIRNKAAQALGKGECAALEQKLKEAFPEAFEARGCQIGQSGAIAFTISETLQELMKASQKYQEISGGKFDMAIEPVSSLWSFDSANPTAPKVETIRDKLLYVHNADITLEDQTATFAMPGAGVEFGGIAKGYIADQIKQKLVKAGVTSAVIDLGGNILCIGSKNGKSKFHIGIQQPFADRNEVIATVDVEDVSVVSSGIYERCFEEDGKFYHHILDPDTGYPVDNDLMAVTIISKKSVDGDGLSTTCFALGLEKGMELIDGMDDVTAVFVTKDEKLHYAKGFKSYLSK